MKKVVCIILCVIAGIQSSHCQTLDKKGRIVHDIQLSPDSQRLAVTNDHTIEIWELAGPRLISTLGGSKGHSDRVYAIAYLPDGRLLSAGRDTSLILWENEEVVWKKSGLHKDIIISLAVSPDGNWIASGGRDGSIVVTSQAGEFVARFEAHGEEVSGVSFSSDNQWLASCGADGKIAVWDISAQIKLVEMAAHKNAWVRDVQFAPDSLWLYACDDRGYVYCWGLEDLEKPSQKMRFRQSDQQLFDIHVTRGSYTNVYSPFVWACAGYKGEEFIKILYASYSRKIHVPIYKILLLPTEGDQIRVALATHGRGAVIVKAEDMHIKR